LKKVNIINKFLTYFVVLAPYSEIVGNLSKIENKGDTLALIFSIDKKIEIPQSAFSVSELKKYINDRVGVINVDGEIYRIRRISNYKKNKLNKGNQNEENKGRKNNNANSV